MSLPTSVAAPDMPLLIRHARRDNLAHIVRMLVNDSLGAQRERLEDPLPASYLADFTAIESDANNELVVAYIDDEVIGTLQLTFIHYLTYCGSWRALIEGVRIDARFRSRGFGKTLLEWAIARSRERGCHMVQLTTNKSRSRAKQFYESLGFVASHEGMKLQLTNP